MADYRRAKFWFLVGITVTVLSFLVCNRIKTGDTIRANIIVGLGNYETLHVALKPDWLYDPETRAVMQEQSRSDTVPDNTEIYHTCYQLANPKTRLLSHSLRLISERSSSVVHSCLKWLVDGDNATSAPYDRQQMLQNQLKRLRNVEQVCKMELSPIYRTKGRGLVFGYKHFVTTIVPKAGCTNLLNTVCFDIGEQCARARLRLNFHTHTTVPALAGGRPSEGELTNTNSSDPFKAIVVRNPWSRLVSTYIQKFIATSEYKFICQISKYHASFNRMKQLKKEAWSFRDFIDKCVVGDYARGILRMNEHYRPQSVIGSLCGISYNFIGKLETYVTDELVIYEKIGITDVDGMREKLYGLRRNNEKHNKTGERYEQYWSSVDQELITQLKKIYAVDLDMFDYPPSPL